jgi:hypothetical protein
MACLGADDPPDVPLTHRIGSKDTHRLRQPRRVPGARDNDDDEGAIA